MYPILATHVKTLPLIIRTMFGKAYALRTLKCVLFPQPSITSSVLLLFKARDMSYVRIDPLLLVRNYES